MRKSSIEFYLWSKSYRIRDVLRLYISTLLQSYQHGLETEVYAWYRVFMRGGAVIG